MSAQDLMNGFAAYTDVEELAAQATTVTKEEASLSLSLASVISGITLSLTAEHTC
ncbi:LxmA leader domain family RiPP [Streptomyces sp. NPDC047028]|uniref:LxmA leader domain family RiPP n=1 Tax=Streptomyces sp. NPDC047028 TaxID=3155793 RepID=UPI0033E82990